ncbi:PTS fructose transporter subunit IIC [Vibrio cholerae]|nr:PTS fructose transporter subunit IIC [Vibrio cholerae]GHY00764.1 PTS fructose transporter subunit IIC [Vibrio cholerae]GIA45870.1 PTS fructose transporter subunit IIC [Vibrio cholerae]
MSTLTAQATNNSSDFKKLLSTMKGHLLFGTSHMLPFIVAGGVLLALAVMASGKGAVPADGLLADISNIGIKGLVLFPIILGGFIGYSIADKPALAPAMISSGIMADMGGGFLGCIVAGFIAGGVVFQLKKIPLSANMTALGAYFIYPLIGTLISAGIVLWGIGEPIKLFMASMNEFLASMAGASKVVLGTILGGMTAFDMGGPINKVATLFAQTQVDTQPWLMGGVGIAICTPPLGMALATFLFKKKFTKQEQEAGKAAAIMGSIGISEGAIPFAANDPMRVLPSIVAGGIVGCVFGFLTNVLLHAPWGGLITAPVSSNIPMYVVGIVLGSLTTALIVGFWKPVAEEEVEDEIAEAAPTQAQAVLAAGEGEYDIVAVTCCPSGVAHTFMAAKALEKAGAAAGIKIKVETQGQNGIKNRITDLDVANAKLVPFPFNSDRLSYQANGSSFTSITTLILLLTPASFVINPRSSSFNNI